MTHALHELNRKFTWPAHKGPFEFLSEDQIGTFDRDGYFLFENAFSNEELAEVTRAIDPLEEEAEALLRTRKNGEHFISKAGAITFLPHIVSQSSTVRAFAKHPILARIARDILGDNTRLYWDQSVYKKPENPQSFPFHQDNGYVFIEPQVYLTCWIPLVDVDENNGCPWVVPGLHRSGTLAHATTRLGYELFAEHEDEVAVPAKAGDIVVFSSLTPHKTGPNLTSHTRKAYILQYAPDGVRVRKSKEDPGTLQTDEDRQFYVVKDGHLVSPGH